MSQPQANTALETAGGKARDYSDVHGPQLDSERGLARFRKAVDEQAVVGDVHTRRQVKRNWMVASLAAVVAAVLVFVSWPRDAVTFTVAHGQTVAVAQWIENDNDTRLVFSDGTEVSAENGSRWRVRETSTEGASLQLERGTLLAKVIPLRAAKWSVDAGPFNIRVTGTQFSTSWDPVTEVFELQMLEGSVVLDGPVVGTQRAVRAPEHLRIDVHGRRLAVVASDDTHAPLGSGEPVAAAPRTDDGFPRSTSRPSESSASAADRPVGEQHNASAGSATAPPNPSVAPTGGPELRSPQLDRPEWATLARSGEHMKALAEAHRLGAESILASETSARLLLLSQTARLAGDGALAAKALGALTTRFPDSIEAGTARFLSGKLHFDQGRYRQAITALNTYLSSGSGATFGDEARVLIIVALSRSGQVAQAKSRAEKYLESNPNSPHAPRIRTIARPRKPSR